MNNTNILLIICSFYLIYNVFAKSAPTTTPENFCKDTDHDAAAKALFKSCGGEKGVAKCCDVMTGPDSNKRFCGCMITNYLSNPQCGTKANSVFKCSFY
uniref:Uncharacterized protein n=1 Tax=Meloidogyne enterolobii TaxID=390850 RepID=A0A6V7VY84_MELEN|nr:unnamed protein product [Meloidogyne enterolobii]